MKNYHLEIGKLVLSELGGGGTLHFMICYLGFLSIQNRPAFPEFQFYKWKMMLSLKLQKLPGKGFKWG